MKPHYRTEAEFLADFARLMAASGAEMDPIERKGLINTDDAYEAARRALEARSRRTS